MGHRLYTGGILLTKVGNAAAGGGLLILSLVGMIATGTISSPLVVDPVGPASYPYALFALIGVLSAILVVDAIRRSKVEHVPLLTRPRFTKGALRVPAILLLGGGYVLALQPLGYLLATVALTAGVQLTLGVRHPARIGFATLVTVTALFLLFGVALGVPLPEGSLGLR